MSWKRTPTVEDLNRSRAIKVRIEGRRLVLKAMRNPDLWAIELTYTDKAGNRTRRVVSPIRWVSGYKFLALCLCRERPQTFDFLRCENVKLKPARDYVMPVPIINLGKANDLQ